MGLADWSKRLLATSADLDAALLREDSATFGADAISDLYSGQVTTITGVVNSLVFRPEIAAPVFEVEIFDGSGAVIVKFMGRRRIRGIEPGSNLALTGRIVRCEGIMTMFNPMYQLLPKAEAQ